MINPHMFCAGTQMGNSVVTREEAVMKTRADVCVLMRVLTRVRMRVRMRVHVACTGAGRKRRRGHGHPQTHRHLWP